jgi:hypothetical protein
MFMLFDFAQHHQRQERHERLVEMQHVEPLALEHCAEPAACSARPSVMVPIEPLAGIGHAVAQADDVALRSGAAGHAQPR